MDLKKIIDSLVERRISEILDGMTSDDRNVNGVGIVDTTDVPRKRRKRGRGRNSVVYARTVSRGRQRDPKAVAKDLPSGNVRVMWLAIVNAKKPISARELEQSTGLGKKSVESAVWALRNAGLIKSQPVAEK